MVLYLSKKLIKILFIFHYSTTTVSKKFPSVVAVYVTGTPTSAHQPKTRPIFSNASASTTQPAATVTSARKVSSKNLGVVIRKKIHLNVSLAIVMDIRPNAIMRKKWTKMDSLWTFMANMKVAGFVMNARIILKASIAKLAFLDFFDRSEFCPMPLTLVHVSNRLISKT